MTRHNTIVAFLSFKVIFNAEARRKIAECALDFRSRASPNARSNFAQRIDETLSIRGFQHASKADNAKILKDLPLAAAAVPRLFEALLNVWRESRAEIETAVESFLENLSAPIETFFLIEEKEQIKGLSAEMLAAASDLAEKLPQYEQFEIEMMLLCRVLCPQIEVVKSGEKGFTIRFDSTKTAETADENMTDFLDETKSGLNSPLLTEWLTALRNLPADAAEWDEIEPFAAAVCALAQSNRRRVESKAEAAAAARDRIAGQISVFFEECREELEYHEKAAPANLSGLPLEILESLQPLVDRLRMALARHADARRETPKSNAEDRARRALLGEIEIELETLFADFDAFSAEAAQQTDEIETAPPAVEEIEASPALDENLSDQTYAEQLGNEAVTGFDDSPVAVEISSIDLKSRESGAESDAHSNFEKANAVETSENPMETPSAANEKIIETTFANQPVQEAVAGGRQAREIKDSPESFADAPVEPAKETSARAAHAEADLAEAAADESADQEKSGRDFAAPIFSFGAAEDSAAIAGLILREGETAENDLHKRDLIWRLIDEEKYGLAYHFVRSLERSSGDSANARRLPSPLLQALIIGRRVRFPNGELVERLREDFEQFGEHCFVGKNSNWDYGVRFLALAGALRPALLAPLSGASGVLYDLKFVGMERLFEFSKIVRDFSENSLPLDLGALKKVRDVAAWNGEAKMLQARVKAWREQAKDFSLSYTPARIVWQGWLKEDGMLGKLLFEFEKTEPMAAQAVAELLEVARREAERLSFKDEIDREIEKARRHLKHPGNEFNSLALRRIYSGVQEALELVRSWIDLQEKSPHREKTFSQQKAVTLHDDLKALRSAVEAEVAAFTAQREPSFAQIGATVLRRALDGLWRLFDAETAVSSSEPPLKHLLNADLLRVGARMDQEWEPQTNAAELETLILRALAERKADHWTTAFALQLERRDHEAAGRLLEYLDAFAAQTATENLDLEEMSRSREVHLRECLAALRRDLDDTKRVIIDAGDLLKMQEHEDSSEKVKGIEALLPVPEAGGKKFSAADLSPQILRFGELQDELSELRRNIEATRNAEIKRARRHLEKLAPPAPLRERIEKLLEQGDAGTAWDLLERFEQKLPLSSGISAAADDSFSVFFPQIFREILQHSVADATTASVSKFIRDLREYGKGARTNLRFGKLDFEKVVNEAEQVAEMLEAWFNLTRLKRMDENSLRAVLGGLGFFNPKITRTTKIGRHFLAQIVCEPLSDRNFCPTPAYGSSANGNYRALLIFDALATPEEIIKDAGETVYQTAPTIIFNFARMSEERRRKLARLAREQRRALVVLDEVLLWFLAAQPSPRLRLFFETTLPFSYGEPYTTTAGQVPDEMFYGRVGEYNSIIDPHGACFIYGGRQLGKTALLRHVERRFHSPEEERIALFFDVKTNGVCRDLNIDDIWTLLHEKFKALGVIPAKKNPRGMDGFLADLKEWVTGKSHRRVLLLLDEADEFLAVDGKGTESATGASKASGEFVRADRLKRLMDDTGRRFKVVFAGLHNVQRTTTLSNHPLAHYGTPVCIGPLLEKGERRAAQDLIKTPMASHGYRFEDTNLVTRILWQTNHYPSLIQLYCRRLMTHLNDRAASPAEAKTAPPYLIRSAHLDEAYNQEFRREIRQRLIWTLQLDPRYEVIGYAMVNASLDDPERARGDGFSVEWVRGEAVYYWAAGFEESDSEEAIRVLLDEMVGLGLLRVLENQNYALRSVNVASLMGTKEEIIEVLFRDREPALTYEPATFRAALRRADGSFDFAKRNPLTAQQESSLQRRENGVGILYGCRAAGLQKLATFLKNRFAENLFVRFDDIADKNIFRERIKEKIDARGEGTTLILISENCAWNAHWLEEAQKLINQRTAPNKFVQILFVADPPTAWSLMYHERQEFERARAAGGINVFNLRPWHDAALRQWLDDCGFALDPQQRERVALATGNWGGLLERFYRTAHGDAVNWRTHLDRLENQFDEAAFALELLDEFGLGELDEPRRLLTEIAELGEEGVAESDLNELLTDFPPESLAASLRWADALGLARSGKNGWYIPPPLARLLRTRKEAAL